jgi:hypothetical protein
MMLVMLITSSDVRHVSKNNGVQAERRFFVYRFARGAGGAPHSGEWRMAAIPVAYAPGLFSSLPITSSLMTRADPAISDFRDHP